MALETRHPPVTCGEPKPTQVQGGGIAHPGIRLRLPGTHLVVGDGRVDRAGGVGHVGRQGLLREVDRGVEGAPRVDQARDVLDESNAVRDCAKAAAGTWAGHRRGPGVRKCAKIGV